MIVCINGRYLGTRKHLTIDISNNVYSWTDDIDSHTWSLGSQDLDLGYLYEKILNKKFKIFDEKHLNSWLTVSKNSSISPDWKNMIPRPEYIDSIRRSVAAICDLFQQLNVDYYGRFFIKTSSILSSLCKAAIDKKIFEEIISLEENRSNHSNLLKFKPDGDGFCDAVRYNRLSSVTGRMVVVSGPNILTLKKDHRRIFKSSFEGGDVYQIDLRSLEPRIALEIAGHSTPPDVYEFVKNRMGISGVTRDEIKVIILGCLYNMSHRTLQKRLGSSINAKKLLNSVKDLFEIKNLERDLRKSIEDNGHFCNYFGREIKSEASLINYFLQSTGADVSLSCFSYFLNLISSYSKFVKPLFVIHDALVVDIHPEYRSTIVDILKPGLKCEKFKSLFPVSIKKF